MKPVVSQASGGQTVDRRCRDIRTVATELGKSEVVEQDYHDVGRVFRRPRGLAHVSVTLHRIQGVVMRLHLGATQGQERAGRKAQR
jgi:hypothetical protein